MKTYKKIIALTICLTLCTAHNTHTFWNDLDTYIQEHHRLIENFEKSMNQLFQTHTKILSDQFQNYSTQTNQNSPTYYQKNISKIVIENNFKSIKINQSHDGDTTLYTIEVYSKNQNNDKQTENTTDDIKTELESLQSYIKKSPDVLSPQAAITILQECINRINQHNKSELITTNIEKNNRKTTYTIQIKSNKKNEAIEPNSKKNKNKKN